MPIGGQTEGLACADMGARTPMGVSGNCILLITVDLPILVLLGIYDDLPALPGQHHTQLWSSIMALHQPFHLGLGQLFLPDL